MAVFTALPTQSGDAFVLETTTPEGKPFVILFDAGLNGYKLHELFDRYLPHVKTIDVAVCSHNDKDHSAGFPNFIGGLEAAEIKLVSLWLPYYIGVVASKFAHDPATFAREVAASATRYIASKSATLLPEILDAQGHDLTVPEYRFWASLETGAEQDPSGRHAPYSAGNVGVGNDSGESKADWSAFIAGILAEVERISEVPAIASRPEASKGEILELALMGATKIDEIRKIVLASEGKVSEIRYFDFVADDVGIQPQGGIIGIFEPVNARERPAHEVLQPVEMSGMVALGLSASNVESLVFASPETAEDPATFFLADSRLATGENKPEKDFILPDHLLPSRPILYTAPHHASEKNDHAYAVLANWLGKSIFEKSLAVRNGGSHTTEIKAWDAIPKSSRRCVQCYQCDKTHDSGFQMQLIKVQSANRNWPTTLPGRDCLDPKRYVYPRPTPPEKGPPLI